MLVQASTLEQAAWWSGGVWPVLGFAVGLPIVAWMLARTLGVQELFAWRPMVREPGDLRAVAASIGAEGRGRGCEGRKSDRFRGDQAVLIRAARTLHRCNADVGVVRAEMDELVESLAAGRQRVRLGMVAGSVALPAVGGWRWLASGPAVTVDPFVTTSAAGWGMPLVLAGLVAVLAAGACSILRWAVRSDRLIRADAESLVLLLETAGSAGSIEEAAERLIAGLQPAPPEPAANRNARAA